MSPEDEYLGKLFSRFCKQQMDITFFLQKKRNLRRKKKDPKLGKLFTLRLIQLSSTFYLQFQVY